MGFGRGQDCKLCGDALNRDDKETYHTCDRCRRSHAFGEHLSQRLDHEFLQGCRDTEKVKESLRKVHLEQRSAVQNLRTERTAAIRQLRNHYNREIAQLRDEHATTIKQLREELHAALTRLQGGNTMDAVIKREEVCKIDRKQAVGNNSYAAPRNNQPDAINGQQRDTNMTKGQRRLRIQQGHRSSASLWRGCMISSSD